jgi:DNA polymerase-4
MRFILHLDMNSFYASVEELQNNKYKNKPIIVSGYTKRSVVASANYIARKFGIRAAMPVFMAQKMCPSLFIVTPHFDLYHQYSEKIIDLISTKFTNNIEIGSIDECYIDITNMVNSQYSPTDIATIIQKTIKVNIGLDCSIGIANNKFLAKMASDYQKPRGITTMYKNEISVKL